MKYFVFQPKGMENCNVKAYIHTSGDSYEMEDRFLPAIIVCPGGGYCNLSDREGEPVALEFFMASSR